MSPLTKALVVLVTFLAVLELGMFAAYSAKHSGLSEQLSSERSARSAAEALARAKQGEFAAAQAKQAQTLAGLAAQVEALTGQLEDARTSQRAAEAQVAAERSRNEKTESAIARLTAAAQQDAVLREALNGELKTARAEIVDLRQKNIELTDAVNERTTTIDTQIRQIRRAAEQLAEVNQRVEQLSTVLAANNIPVPEAGAAVVARTSSEVPINGNVTQVDSSSGTTIVAVNVGANDGVTKGMEFMVHRGDTYLGKLVIENVDANVAAGQITLNRGAIQKGDSIYAGPVGG